LPRENPTPERRVETHKHDKVFIVTFGFVLAILGAFTLAIMVIAKVISGPVEAEEGAIARLEERIKPVGEVITDPAALMQLAAAAPARAPMSGAEIVTKVCSACHGTGVLGAPKIGDKGEWSRRKAAGMAALVASSIKGKNQMPPKGGDPSLSDDEVKAAVSEILKQTGV
jgi:cytochrome c5